MLETYDRSELGGNESISHVFFPTKLFHEIWEEVDEFGDEHILEITLDEMKSRTLTEYNCYFNAFKQAMLYVVRRVISYCSFSQLY